MLKGFKGEHIQKMDTKGRVIVPAKFRDVLGDQCIVITRGLDGCLFAYSEKEWEVIEEKLSGLPITKANARDFSRFFLAGAHDLETDKLGRVLMPTALRKFASLKNEVVWSGMGKRIEIWDIDRWNDRLSSYAGFDEEDGVSDEAIEKMNEIAESMSEYEF